jgi:hypothetical protein
MLNKKVFVSLILLSGLVQTGLQAQDATTATGGNAKGTGGTVSYSVGQTVYTTNSGTSGTVAQGVQQPYEISVISGINDGAITLDCTAYPNPTTDYLRLKIADNTTINLTYQIYDINGKLLLNKIVEGSETTISMQGLVPGSYFLKVTDNKQEIKTFKIIKN